MPNEIIRQEQEINVLDVNGRAFNVVANTESGIIKKQEIVTCAREFVRRGEKYQITVKLRFDDCCNNGHEDFAITGDIKRFYQSKWVEDAGGCIHDEIAKQFPKLAPLIKWHLCSVDGPMHYIANTCYMAGERDCHGLLQGEERQIKNGRTGHLAWKRVAIDADGNQFELHQLDKYADSDTPPKDTLTVKWVPWCRTGEGKDRELDGARHAAIWPEATDAELSVPRDELEVALKARLPNLLADFKAAMLDCGFVWPSRLESQG